MVMVKRKSKSTVNIKKMLDTDFSPAKVLNTEALKESRKIFRKTAQSGVFRGF